MENKRRFAILVLALLDTAFTYAQWTKEDSVWLDNVLSGKETLKLNPETQRAIDSGTFINMDIQPPKEQMRSNPTRIPISKDFSEYIHVDKTITDVDTMMKVDFSKMPPYVLMRYGPKIYLEEKLGSFHISPQERDTLKALTPAGQFVAEDILRSIFWKSHRAKMRNRKNANAWKTY